jgi:hypothetical protein
MRIIASLSVELPKRPKPLPLEDAGRPQDPGLTRLIVIVVDDSTPDGSLTAYGLDPDHLDPRSDRPVFERCLGAGQRGTFLERVVNGDYPDPPVYRGGITRTVETPVPTPPTTGPKVHPSVFRFARAMRKDEIVTQVSSEPADTDPAQDTSPPL